MLFQKPKLYVLLSKRTNNSLQIIGKKKIKFTDTFVRIGKDKTIPVDPSQCIYFKGNKYYILVDVDVGQISVDNAVHEAKPAMFKLLDDLVSTQVIRQIGRRLDSDLGISLQSVVLFGMSFALGVFVGILFGGYLVPPTSTAPATPTVPTYPPAGG